MTESSGIWFAVLLLLAPLYLTYKVYRAGVESDAADRTVRSPSVGDQTGEPAERSMWSFGSDRT